MKRLTKSQYEVIADSLHRSIVWLSQTGQVKREAVEGVAHQLAHDLERYDKEFDRVKFLTLCGITD